MRIQEQLGVSYEQILVTTEIASASARDRVSGQAIALQEAPRLPHDPPGAATVRLALINLPRDGVVDLEPSNQSLDTRISITHESDRIVIANGAVQLAVPTDSRCAQPFPGPILGMKVGNGEWFGASSLVDAPFPGAVQTVIESIGPACIQWRVTYRWGGAGGAALTFRWASGSDTIEVSESCAQDSDAWIEFFPHGESRAKAYARGGGEHLGPMHPLVALSLPNARSGRGRRSLGHVSHISYWNQWNLAWAGFTGPTDAFVGIFSMFGNSWRERGRQRIEILEDDARGHLCRLPIRKGTRYWGLLISTAEQAGVTSTTRRCLLNRRKVQQSDFALDKVRHWELDPPLEPKEPRLVDRALIASMRKTFAEHPELGDTCRAFLKADDTHRHYGALAAAYAIDDRPHIAHCITAMLEVATSFFEQVGDGGYERLIIFDGRRSKPLGYDLDVLWADNLIDERGYRLLRRLLLAEAYMYADQDYCAYQDFMPSFDPQAPDLSVYDAMRDEMGDCPVPPNFVSEFFSTPGVMAELFPAHPQAGVWRHLAARALDCFGKLYFAPDGTYLESINYHQHAFNEILLHVWAMRHAGLPDPFEWGWVKGSFQHFIEVQMPALAHAMPALSLKGHTIYVDPPDFKRTPFIPNGNSGSEGNQQNYQGELSLGAFAYRASDPALAAQLMQIWRDAGRPLVDSVHPLLTLLTLDLGIKPQRAPWKSSVRQTLGLFSKSVSATGDPIYAMFRAGHATHHMDFDQGHLSLAMGDRVLLGDLGYHGHDAAGKNLPACATWPHSTIVYSDDKTLSSGYTGLEMAPDPILIHTDDEMDWCVHRIVNTHFRCIEKLRYMEMIPGPRTVHVRHFLFVKPDYILLWDVFEESHGPAISFFHPHEAVQQLAPDRYRAGLAGMPHLELQVLHRGTVEVIENQAMGPLWSLGLKFDPTRPLLTLVIPQRAARKLQASWDEAGAEVLIKGAGVSDRIVLPKAGKAELPQIVRNSIKS